MSYRDTPGNRTRYNKYREEYAEQVKALPTDRLFALVRNSDDLDTRSEILKDAIYSLACEELASRGHKLPVLSALLNI